MHSVNCKWKWLPHANVVHWLLCEQVLFSLGSGIWLAPAKQLLSCRWMHAPSLCMPCSGLSALGSARLLGCLGQGPEGDRAQGH